MSGVAHDKVVAVHDNAPNMVLAGKLLEVGVIFVAIEKPFD